MAASPLDMLASPYRLFGEPEEYEEKHYIHQENGQMIYQPRPDSAVDLPKGTEVYICQLPPTLTIEELLPVVKKCGELHSLRLMMEFGGGNRGFAYARYMEPRSAQKAVKELSGYFIKPNHPIKVFMSTDNCRLFIGQIRKTLSKQEIKDLLEKETEGLKDVIIYLSPTDKNLNRGFCFAEYDCHRNAAMARRKLITLDRIMMMWSTPESHLKIDWAIPEQEVDENIMSKVKVVYVRNLMLRTSEASLKAVVTKALPSGEIVRLCKTQAYAFIHFKSRRAAEKALNYLNGYHLDGADLEATWAKPPPVECIKSQYIKGNKTRSKNERACTPNKLELTEWAHPSVVANDVEGEPTWARDSWPEYSSSTSMNNHITPAWDMQNTPDSGLSNSFNQLSVNDFKKGKQLQKTVSPVPLGTTFLAARTPRNPGYFYRSKTIFANIAVIDGYIKVLNSIWQNKPACSALTDIYHIFEFGKVAYNIIPVGMQYYCEIWVSDNSGYITRLDLFRCLYSTIETAKDRTAVECLINSLTDNLSWDFDDFDVLGDDVNGDNEILTALVRSSYLKHLLRSLNTNYNLWLEKNQENEDFNEVCPSHIKKCADFLEHKALRACMLTSYYRRFIIKVLKDIKHSTEEGSLFSPLIEQVFDSKSAATKKFFDKETQTNVSLFSCKTNECPTVETEKVIPPSTKVIPPPITVVEPLVGNSNLLVIHPQNDIVTVHENGNSIEDLFNILMHSPSNSEKESFQSPRKRKCSENESLFSVEDIHSSDDPSSSMLNNCNELHKSDLSFDNTKPPQDSFKRRKDSIESETKFDPAEEIKPKKSIDERLQSLAALFGEDSPSPIRATNLSDLTSDSSDEDLKKSIPIDWKVEYIAQNCNLKVILSKMSSKKRYRLHKRFKLLFGPDRGVHTYISVNEQALSRKRTANLVVGELTPHYIAGRIASRDVFKALAKKITDDFLNISHVTGHEEIAKKVGSYFENGRCINSSRDITQINL